jgi:NAD-dependent dihydropyrimidine dehydrogenase PreA subunit
MAIDETFYNSRPVAGNHVGHHVFGPIQGPKKLGIHGSVVGVDFDICIGDGACISACPVNVFDWLETPGCESPNVGGELKAEKKADPTRESECILCLACEGVCPVTAIKITDPANLPGIEVKQGDIGIAGGGAAAPASGAAPASAPAASAAAAAPRPAAAAAPAPKPAVAAAPAPEPPKIAEKVTPGAAAALAQAQEALKQANDALAAAMKAAAVAQELANKAVEEQKKGR